MRDYRIHRNGIHYSGVLYLGSYPCLQGRKQHPISCQRLVQFPLIMCTWHKKRVTLPPLNGKHTSTPVRCSNRKSTENTAIMLKRCCAINLTNRFRTYSASKSFSPSVTGTLDSFMIAFQLCCGLFVCLLSGKLFLATFQRPLQRWLSGTSHIHRFYYHSTLSTHPSPICYCFHR